jgi:hypothetical protein
MSWTSGRSGSAGLSADDAPPAATWARIDSSRAYTKEWREIWLRRVLEAQQAVRHNGPAEFRELTLIAPAELHEIRRIWLYEKQEFDDRLPAIYEEVTRQAFCAARRSPARVARGAR